MITYIILLALTLLLNFKSHLHFFIYNTTELVSPIHFDFTTILQIIDYPASITM